MSLQKMTSPMLLDETGKDMITVLESIRDVISKTNYDPDVYGFIEHLDVLDPSQRITYIGANSNYRPLTVDLVNGTYDLGDWSTFYVLAQNKPYMVHWDGTIDYQLNENDYTKKLDGTASDVSDASYDGGAFSLIPKIYKCEYVDGNNRYVLFSSKKRPGYIATGFIDSNGNELAGRWLPMFYASISNNKATCIAGTQPSASINTDGQKTAIEANGTAVHFFGGSFVETVNDLLMMFAKNSNYQASYGNGNMSGYNSTDTYSGVKANAVVGHGQFYGTTDGKSLNKILHSIVLGSYQQWMRDPYELIVNGRVKVSKNYVIDLTGATYTDTGIDVENIGNWTYPTKYTSVEGYGSIPVSPYSGGSTITGVCDGTYVGNNQTSILAVCQRFGCAADGLRGGLRARSWAGVAGRADWGAGFAALLDKPV